LQFNDDRFPNSYIKTDFFGHFIIDTADNSIIEIVFERLHKVRHLRRKCKYRRLTGLTDYNVALSLIMRT